MPAPAMSVHPLQPSPYYQPNPDYGAGVYRRGIRLTGADDEVLAELEDTHHGMRVRLRHDGATVTHLHAETLRVPTTHCSGAAFALARLIGTPLTITTRDLYGAAQPNLHCTHLFDLAALAIAHTARGNTVRRYDVTIPDETAAGAWCTVACNDEVVHRWLIGGQILREPAAYAGQPVLKGFIPWAFRQFIGDVLEAALVFQKGFFVSNARRRRYDVAHGLPIIENRHLHGVCFTYQPENMRDARHIDSTRDFSERSEDVLNFIP